MKIGDIDVASIDRFFQFIDLHNPNQREFDKSIL